jgi:sugar-phosphatase
MLGFDPSTCLVIEDAPAGIRAAHAAGMKAIAITSTYPAQDLHEADVVISSLTAVQVVSVPGGNLEVLVTKS